MVEFKNYTKRMTYHLVIRNSSILCINAYYTLTSWKCKDMSHLSSKY